MVNRANIEPVEMLYRVRVVKMTDGERLPLVVDQRGLPLPNPNQWSIFMRRPEVQQNTLIEELRTIAHCYDWATRRGIDLDARFASCNGLSPAELTALYQNLRYVRTFGRKTAARRLTDIREAAVVSGKVHSTRVGYAREYLVWGLERMLYQLDVSDPRLPDIRERRNKIQRAAIDFQRATSDGNAKRVGLSPELRARFLDVINPENPHNPFMRTVRFRNWVLLVLMLTFGFRRGEVLKLYVADANVKGRSPTLNVYRRPGDPNDTRAQEPAVKTLGRAIPLIDTMTRLLNAFIMHHRPRFPRADMLPFLFLSEEGEPLSLRSVNAIIERIVRVFPEFDGLLSPHILRYTYNDMFYERAQAAGLDGEAFKGVQNYLNGWALNSDQGSLYTRRAIAERAGKISLDHQRNLFS